VALLLLLLLHLLLLHMLAAGGCLLLLLLASQDLCHAGDNLNSIADESNTYVDQRPRQLQDPVTPVTTCMQ
jgi:hypothetical protein